MQNQKGEWATDRQRSYSLFVAELRFKMTLR